MNPPAHTPGPADDIILTQPDINLCLGSGELLPCPFCGSNAMSHGEPTPNGKAICWRITCTGMKRLIPMCAASVWGTDPDQDKARAAAVAKWNRRDWTNPKHAALLSALEASEELLAFHEGTAAPEFEGAHPTIRVNGEDWQELLKTVRTALSAAKAQG